VIGYTVKLEYSRSGVDLKLRELNLVKISDNSDLIGCGVSSYRLPTFFKDQLGHLITMAQKLLNHLEQDVLSCFPCCF
jgi:hypothetical protein